MKHNHHTEVYPLRANDLWIGVCLLLSNNPRNCCLLQHSYQTGVCLLRAASYQTFAHLSRSLQIKVGLSPRTEARMSSTCNYRFDPRPLPFCGFSLKMVYSPSIQVVTRISSACSHRSVPRSLHLHDHENIHPPCSHDQWSNPHPPWDEYTPFLDHFASHIDGHETPFLWITLMFHGITLSGEGRNESGSDSTPFQVSYCANLGL